MKILFVFLFSSLGLWRCIASDMSQLHAEDEPWANEKPLVSPKGTFTISQHLSENWSTTLHFNKGNLPDINFKNIDGGDGYSWPALFYISPDDQWILQIQKLGSGENIAFLYKTEPTLRLWRMVQNIEKMAFDYLLQKKGIDRKKLYHTGIDFVKWNLKRNELIFTVFGSEINVSGTGIHDKLIYNLSTNVIESH